MLGGQLWTCIYLVASALDPLPLDVWGSFLEEATFSASAETWPLGTLVLFIIK